LIRRILERCVSHLEESNKKSGKKDGISNLDEGSTVAGTLRASTARVGGNRKISAVAILDGKDGGIKLVIKVSDVHNVHVREFHILADNPALGISNDASTFGFAIKLATIRTIRASEILRIIRIKILNGRQNRIEPSNNLIIREVHTGTLGVLFGHVLSVAVALVVSKITTEQIVFIAHNHLHNCILG